MTGLLALLVACAPASPPPATPVPPVEHVDTALQAELERLVAGFRGDVGVHVRHLGTGATAGVNADSLFPTASMIKVPLLVALFDRVHAGELRLEEELTFRDSLRYAEYDLTAKLRDGETVPLRQLAFLMVSFSDNTASLWIQALVGGGAAVNDWLAAHGFTGTRVNSRTPGRRADWEVYGWGQTTPREMSRLMTMIRERRAVSPQASEQMFRLLSRTYWDDVGLAPLPATVLVASKQGMVSRSRSETLLVASPGGEYALTVITKNQEDTRFAPDNEGYALIRAVSHAAYRRFNP